MESRSSFLTASLAAAVLVLWSALPATSAFTRSAPRTLNASTSPASERAPALIPDNACTFKVKPGGTNKCTHTITCGSRGTTKSCGTVRWSTKFSIAGLSGKFSPNPGDPSTQTISCKKSVKPGQYTNTITLRASGDENGKPITFTETITVT